MRKPRPAGNETFAVPKPRTPRHAGKLYWELLVAAIGCSAKFSGSDFYCGIAHKFEYFVYQQSCLEALHPAFEINYTLLILMKGSLEALHPNPFVWLVCESVCEMVHFLNRSLVAVIESNE